MGCEGCVGDSHGGPRGIFTAAPRAVRGTATAAPTACERGACERGDGYLRVKERASVWRQEEKRHSKYVCCNSLNASKISNVCRKKTKRAEDLQRSHVANLTPQY